MRLNVHSYLDTSEGITAGARSFRIKASAHAFKILVDQYQFPIRATVREIITNAADIHIRTNQARPFEVIAPSLGNDYKFVVRDYGTGLSDEEIDNLFATFFSSDKTNTDSETGCLGLGCKCPLTYVDQFYIESRRSGINTLTSIFVAEDGVPHVLKHSETPTLEPDGLTVTVPVAATDASKFAEEISYVLSYIDVPFTCTVPVANDRVFFFGTAIDDKVTMRFLREGAAKCTLIAGGVPYTIPREIFSWDIRSVLDEFNIELLTPMGLFDIHPSRESLILRPESIERLKDILATGCKGLYAAHQALINAKPTFKEALTLWLRIKQGIYWINRSIRGQYDYPQATWDGKTLSSIRVENPLTVTRYVRDYGRRGGRSEKRWRPRSTLSDGRDVDVGELVVQNSVHNVLLVHIEKQRDVLRTLTAFDTQGADTAIVFVGERTAVDVIAELLDLDIKTLDRPPRKPRKVDPEKENLGKFMYKSQSFRGTKWGNSECFATTLLELGDVLLEYSQLSIDLFKNLISTKIITLPEGMSVRFVEVPEGHTKVRRALKLQTLADFISPTGLCPLNYDRLAEVQAWKHAFSHRGQPTVHSIAYDDAALAAFEAVVPGTKDLVTAYKNVCEGYSDRDVVIPRLQTIIVLPALDPVQQTKCQEIVDAYETWAKTHATVLEVLNEIGTYYDEHWPDVITWYGKSLEVS